MKLTKGWVVLLFVSVLWVPALMSQTAGTGALTGTVKDPSGAVIPNATVTATSVDTGQVRTTMTGGDGVYRFSLLPPGNYRVRIEASGFKPVEVPAAAITVTETAVLDRSLEVGAQAQTVTVEGEVETVQTASSALGGVVTTATVTALPLSTRNYTNLLAMAAGANGDLTNSVTLGKASSAISVNGADIGQNTYLQDGVAINSWLSVNTTQEGTGYGAFPIPNPDTIQEFKIQTSTYDAGYGRNPGANVNVLTKSGTNQFHGTAFEFFRNTALNANDWFRNATNGSKLVLNENQYGGTFGGPIKKDKLFFFTAYQETQQKNGIAGFGYSVVTLPPIPAGDRAASAFVPALGAAFCNETPGTKRSIKVACDGSNINPVALNILQLKLANGNYLVPGSYSVAGADPTQQTLASFTDPAIYHNHQGMGNLDYVISTKNSLAVRYYFETDPVHGNFASNGTRITATSIVPGSPVEEAKTNQAAVVRLTTILSNNLVNEARVSYQRLIATAHNLTPFTNSQIGVTDLTPGQDTMSAFQISGLGNLTWGGSSAFGVLGQSNQFEYADQLSWSHGKHTFRTGFEAERVQADQSSPGSSLGTISFRTFSDFLLGRPAGPVIAGGNGSTNSSVKGIGGTTTANSQFDFNFRILDLNSFIQDDIKLNSRLTVNLGVRWEWDGFPVEKHGNTTDIWPSLVNTVPNPGSGCVIGGVKFGLGAAGNGCSFAGFVVPANYTGPLPRGVYQNATNYVTRTSPPWDDFAPRVGFAWQPTSSNRFVVRGGAGYFYDVINGVQAAFFPMRVTPGIENVGSATAASYLGNPWTGALPPAVPGPPGTFGFTPRWVDPATGNSSGIQQNMQQQNITVPLTYEWNLNTQYQFVGNWVLELGYVGSRGIHQEQYTNWTNSIPWNWALLASPSNPINGVTTNSSAAGNINQRVQNLGFSSKAIEYGTTGYYKYNALLATVRKQFSHGLQVQAAFTYNAAFATSAYGINTAPYVILQLARNPEYHPKRLVVNYSWDLPFGHMTGFAGKILQGWSVSGVTSIQNGVPFSVYDSGGGGVFFQGGAAGDMVAPAQFCPGMSLSNAVTSGSITQRVSAGIQNARLGLPGGYLNPAAFCSSPLLGTNPADTSATGFGNIGAFNILSPGQSNWDISLAKVIRIRERHSLQFRAEFFNAFNHPQFSFTPANDDALTAQDVSQSSFGQIKNMSVNPRLIQFALKYSF